MGLERFMLHKLLYIIRLGRYLCRKPPTNFSEEAFILWVPSSLGFDIAKGPEDTAFYLQFGHPWR